MKNKINATLLLIFFSFSQQLIGQTVRSKSLASNEKMRSIQIAFFPIVQYNSIALGYGVKKKRIEHVGELSSYFAPLGGNQRFVIGLHFNRNYYLKKNVIYIPVWTGIRRINKNNNFEDGGPYYDLMDIRLGSGIGVDIKIKAKHAFRFELGVGAGLRFENTNSYDNESPFPFRLALREFTLIKDLPVLPTGRFKIRYALRF